jgi:hypothetical protein
MPTFSPGIDTYQNKTDLMTLFGYHVVDDVIETPCGDLVEYETLWKWLVRNGVSLQYSYQKNMSVYLERFGFTRILGSQKRVDVQDILGRDITQRRALFAADLVRSKALNVPCVLILNGKYVYVANTYFPIEKR